MPSERTCQEEANGANFSSVAPSGEELYVYLLQAQTAALIDTFDPYSLHEYLYSHFVVLRKFYKTFCQSDNVGNLI